MMGAIRRTQSSLFHLFRRKCQYTQQFDQYFNHCLNQCRSGLDLRIDLESPQEVFDALEDVNEGIVAFPHVFGRLADTFIIIG